MDLGESSSKFESADASQGHIVLVDRLLMPRSFHPCKNPSGRAFCSRSPIIASPNNASTPRGNPRRSCPPAAALREIDRIIIFSLHVGIVRPRAEPQAEHITRQQGIGPMSLAISFTHPQNRRHTRKDTSRRLSFSGLGFTQSDVLSNNAVRLSSSQ